MQVIIHEKITNAFAPIEIDVCRVELKATPARFDYLVPFHCHICACILLQYSGKVISIAWGLKERVHVPFVIMCPKCKQKYLFAEVIEEVV